ncbi:MAG: hypothetical protein A2Z18_05595 [Armatimonadetes bacterium RBG_16_58_9]|nr:MAG: hypothetical protein A2Z18_05595 [Armatimonadetes bacterium RBG_16_58_9]
MLFVGGPGKMKHLLLIILLILLLYGSAIAAPAEDSTSVLGESVAAGAKALQADGAAPGATQAEMYREAEAQFQRRVATISALVNALETRIGDMRRQASAPPAAEIHRANQDLALLRQEANNLATLSASPLAQVQRGELLDRIFEMNLAMEIMNARWETNWPVFGMAFFQDGASLSGPIAQIVPGSYRIRPGDTLTVITTSDLGAQSEYALTVDTSGGIRLSGAGYVAAAGKTAGQVREALREKLGARFANLRVDVQVQKLTTLQVQVSGEVVRPGTYTLGGVPTVFSALYQAGGPKESGSFRRISVFRDGVKKRNIDLYDFLLTGSKEQDIPLEDGDLVFVDTVGPTVAIGGEVIRPGRYEPEFPIMLDEFLKMAGGPKAGGYLHNIQVERVVNNEYVVLLSEALSGAKAPSKFNLQPGDEVSVLAVKQDTTNKVSVSGPVAVPGVYGLKDGMRVSELVKLARGLANDQEVYGGRADVLRIDPLGGSEILTFNLDKALTGDPANDLLLKKLDRVFLYNPDQIVFRPRLITLNGAVARPGTYKRTEGMRVGDVIAAAGGVRPQAYLERADLIRRQEDDSTTLLRIDLQAALNGDPDANTLLADRDEISVYTRDEVRRQERTVRIEGAVQRPGVYLRSENMRVSDLVFAGGGLLPESSGTIEVARRGNEGDNEVIAVDAARLVACSDEDVVLRDGDVVTVPTVNPYERSPRIVYVSGEVTRPGPYALKSRTETLADIIQRAGGLTDIANVSGALFLRQKENLENAQQAQDVERVLRTARMFADKEFLTHLAKMGLQMPKDIVEVTRALRSDEAKPVEVVAEERLVTTGELSAATKPEANLLSQAPAEKTAETPETPTTAMGPPVASLVQTNVYEGKDLLAPITESARISVNLVKALEDAQCPDNLTLCDGDRIFIPKTTNVVTVIGAVLHPHSFAAGPGKNADYYVERSGGYAQDAARGHVIVVRANGNALPKDAVKSVEPGDVVVVPTSGFIDVTKKWEKTRDITKVLSDVLSSVFILTRF